MRAGITAGVTIVALAAQTALATGQQVPDGSLNRAAIAKLDFMVGRWTGEAWMQRGPERVKTRMVEAVERKLGGLVLQVEGIGTVATTDSAPARVVHHALAVISFNAQAGTYGLRSYIAAGQYGDFELTLVPGGVRWQREVPGGRIRNTALISGDEWHEVGEFSLDGVEWTQIMDIRLRRQSSP